MKSKFNPVQHFLKNPTSKLLAIKSLCAHYIGHPANYPEKGFKANLSPCLHRPYAHYNYSLYRPKNAPERQLLDIHKYW